MTEYLEVETPRSTAKPAQSSRKNPVAAALVWLVWAGMLAAALNFVDTYGSNVPSWDGWDMVPVLTHHQPITLHWLWSQHNEHRVPVPRLLLIGLHRLRGINFRRPMFFNVIVVGILAAAMILVARRLRGHISYADAFFPILMLNYGQAVNMIWGWQAQFYSSMALSIVALLFLAQTGPEMRLRIALPIGICLILLVGCGANGLVLVPPLAVYLAYAAYSRRSQLAPGAARAPLIIFSLAAVALLLCVLYMIGWQRVPYYGLSLKPWWPLQAAKLAVMGFGPGMAGLSLQLQPAPFWRVPFLLVLAVLCVALLVLISTLRARASEHLRSLGLLAFLVAMGLGLASVGLGRNPFETRYVTLFAPIWCCVYFIFLLYASQEWRSGATAALLAIALVTLLPNTRFGIEYAHDVRGHLARFEQDMKAGVPPFRLIYRHGKYLHPHEDIVREYMPMLREARVGSFIYLRNDPVFRELPIRLVPQATNDLTWQDGTAFTRSNRAYLQFSLPQPVDVAGIRIKYTVDNPTQTAPYLFVYWRANEHQVFDMTRFDAYSPTGDHDLWRRPTVGQLNDPVTTNVFWTLDRIKDLQIHPDLKPGVFRLYDLTFLIAEDESVTPTH